MTLQTRLNHDDHVITMTSQTPYLDDGGTDQTGAVLRHDDERRRFDDEADDLFQLGVTSLAQNRRNDG